MIVKSQYNHPNGWVKICSNDNTYSVSWTCKPFYELHIFDGLDLFYGYNVYRSIKRFIRGHLPRTDGLTSCSFPQQENRPNVPCCSENCPKQLGGHQFYKLLCNACYYRTR